MLPPEHLIAHHGGVCRTSDLRRFGVTSAAIGRAVERGSILRVRQGVFATVSADATVVRAAEHGGALTCCRALRLHGIWTLDDDDTPHVWLGRKSRIHHVGCACIGHWHDGASTLGLAPLEDVLLDIYRCRGAETFFAGLESALRQRKIVSLSRLRSRLPASARWLVDLARHDADSGLESLLRLRLHLLGVALQCQVVIDGVGRVDFVIAGRIILEADGEEFHGGSAERRRDRRRDAESSVRGYETLRFDYDLIIRAWPVVQAAILRALVRHGVTPAR